jgi:hypothetical protein
MPFLKTRPNLPAILRHPTPEVIPGDSERPVVTLESGGNPPILLRVDSVDKPMREFSVHAANLSHLEGLARGFNGKGGCR